VSRPGRKGLCRQTISGIGCPHLTAPQGETMLGWTSSSKSCLALSVLTLGSLPADSWPQPGSPFLTLPPPPASQSAHHLQAPRKPDFTHHFCPNFLFQGGSNGTFHLLTGLQPWRLRSWVLALAWLLIYHSLKLSYLLPYLLSVFSLWNASSVRTGTLSPLQSALTPGPEPSLLQMSRNNLSNE
jgi:hypothetical protein